VKISADQWFDDFFTPSPRAWFMTGIAVLGHEWQAYVSRENAAEIVSPLQGSGRKTEN
jgi:hypothetical protein